MVMCWWDGLCLLVMTIYEGCWRPARKQATSHGLMLVYVDDLLMSGESEVIQSAMDAVAKKWTISPVEWV